MTEENLTEITKEILNRTNELKESTKKSMIVGEINIIRGIIVFETIVKKINPSKIDEEEIDKIRQFIDMYMINKEELTQSVNHYMKQGIMLCNLILYSYNKDEKRKILKNNENSIN